MWEFEGLCLAKSINALRKISNLVFIKRRTTGTQLLVEFLGTTGAFYGSCLSVILSKCKYMQYETQQ